MNKLLRNYCVAMALVGSILAPATFGAEEAEVPATPAPEGRPARFYDVKLPLPATFINGDAETAASRQALIAALCSGTSFSAAPTGYP